jgi:hypothetical protein
LKKRVRHSNRRRKKTVAQRKAAYARCVASTRPLLSMFDEKRFLRDALEPFQDTIIQSMASYFPAEEMGDLVNDPEEAVAYAVDLIDDANLIATAVNDVYHEGAEAGLRHVEQAIEWRVAFDKRRTAVSARTSNVI